MASVSTAATPVFSRASRADAGSAAISGDMRTPVLTVLLDSRRVVSCLTLAVAVGGRAVTTIEGIARDGELHPMQQAFIDHDAFQ